jgi:low affinity Fe/Cu permease
MMEGFTVTWDKLTDYLLRGITAVGVIVTAMKSFLVSKQVQEIHLAVNSRLDQLLRAKDEAKDSAVATATAESHAAGLQQGQAQATRSIAEDKAQEPPK